MTFGFFHSSEPRLSEDIISSFFFNKSLQQRGLEYRLGDIADDIRFDMRLVGGALLKQQERAAKRYERAAGQTTTAVERQTAEVVRAREEQATNARQLRAAVEDSTRVLQKSIDASANAITTMHGALVDQLSHVRWALAEQNHLLHGIFETLRESRSNECRQLVAQGEKNMQARFYPEAEERLKLALTYDNTDHVLHQNLGLVSMHLGKPDVALEHFRRALAFPPKAQGYADREKVAFFLARAATHAARVLYAKGDTHAAAEYLEKALHYDGRAAKNWYDLAVMKAYEGDAAGVERALRYAIAFEREYYAQALGDTELNPVRETVDRLLLTLRDVQRDHVEAVLSEIATLERLTTKAAQLLPRVPTVPSDLRTHIDAARARNTFFALDAAHREALQLLDEIPSRIVAEIECTVTGEEGDLKKALAANEAKHADERTLLAADVSKRSDARYKSGPEVAAYIGIGCAGGILGLILCTVAAHGRGLLASFLIGYIASVLLVGFLNMVRKSGAETAFNDSRAEMDGLMREKAGAAEEIRQSSARTIKQLRALHAEIAAAFNLSKGA